MKIVCFAASNSQNSINKQLVGFAAELAKAQLTSDDQVQVLDLNHYEMPIYSIDREQADGIPEEARRFFDQVQSADAVIISFAEHNGAYTAAYKNIFDWASRINAKVYADKAALLLATSPGPGGARNVLKLAADSFPHFGASVCGTLSVGTFGEAFDSNQGELIDPVRVDELKDLIKTMIAEAS